MNLEKLSEIVIAIFAASACVCFIAVLCAVVFSVWRIALQ